MTNTSLAIQKAVEGGWKPSNANLKWTPDMVRANYYDQPTWALIPDFWQALAKTEGWKPEEETGAETQDIALGLGFGGSEYVWFNGPEWKLKQYCLIDAIQQGRSIDEFFGEILKK